MVKIRTCVAGCWLRIHRQASRPSISAMLISKTTTSGLRFCTISSASRPVRASRTMFMSCCMPKGSLIPGRRTAESGLSTSRTCSRCILHTTHLQFNSQLQALAGIFRQPTKSRLQTKIVEDAWTQLLRQGADVVERSLGETGQVLESFVQMRAGVCRDGCTWQDLERLAEYLRMYQERCEILTALVVQLEGEAVPLFFLRLQDEHGLLAPGSLQSIEHAIECPGQLANFRIR